MRYIPIIAKIGLGPTYDVIATGAKLTNSITKFLTTKTESKTITKFITDSDLLHKFEMIKAFESEINNERSKGLRDVLIEIEKLLGIIKRDLELNTKILIPFYKFDIEKHLPRLEELNQLLDIRFNLLCSILQTLN